MTSGQLPYLDWRWPEGKELVPGSLGVAVHVNEDMYAVLVDAIRGFPIAWNLGGQN